MTTPTTTLIELLHAHRDATTRQEQRILRHSINRLLKERERQRHRDSLNARVTQKVEQEVDATIAAH